jgi:hypothetical protein
MFLYDQGRGSNVCLSHHLSWRRRLECQSRPTTYVKEHLASTHLPNGSQRHQANQILKPWRSPDSLLRTLVRYRPKCSNSGALQDPDLCSPVRSKPKHSIHDMLQSETLEHWRDASQSNPGALHTDIHEPWRTLNTNPRNLARSSPNSFNSGASQVYVLEPWRETKQIFSNPRALKT